MKTVKDLMEQRAKLTTEMRKIVDNPKGTGGDLDSEQENRFSTLENELKTLEKSIDRQQKLDEAERRMNGQQITGTGDAKLDEARREFRLLPVLAQAAGIETGADLGREREVISEIRRASGRQFRGVPIPMEIFEQRVQTVGGDASDLVATDHLGGQFIDKLREAVVVRSMGARVLRNLSGNVSIPRLTTSGTSGWVAENAALSPADHVFDAVTASPKHAGAITELSRNTLQQTSPDLEQLTRMDFAKILAAALDTVAIKGGGANEPTGVLGTVAVESVDCSTPTWEKIQEIIGKVEDENATGTGWITRPSVVRTLRTTNKVSGEAEHGFIMTDRRTLDGYPLRSTKLVPTAGASPDSTYLIFGNWSDLILCFWSELDVLVNPFESDAFKKGNIQIRCMLTADVLLRHTESFAYGENLDV